MTSYSQALTLFDRADYAGAVEMQPVMQDAPNSLVVISLTCNKQRRAADRAQKKAKDKITGGIRSIFEKL